MTNDANAAILERSADRPSAASRSRSHGELWRILHNGKAVVGILILAFFIILAVFGPWIAPGDPTAFVDLPNRPPSASAKMGMACRCASAST